MNPGRPSRVTRSAVPAPGPSLLVRFALEYAGRGWPVFPCRPGRKEPATRHGFLDATTDPDQIRAWWRRDPAANLAIATGLPGPDVLDVDRHSGDDRDRGSAKGPAWRVRRKFRSLAGRRAGTAHDPGR